MPYSELRRYRWKGPQPDGEGELIANAPDTLFELLPASEARAIQTRANWANVLPGQTIPMIGEILYGYEELVD